MTDTNNREFLVNQLQCVSWPDMEAPRDTATLTELYEFTDNLVDENNGMLLLLKNGVCICIHILYSNRPVASTIKE